MKLRSIIALAFALVFATSASAQVAVNDTLTAEELVNDFLLGEGVTATNVTFNGMPGDEVYIQSGLYYGNSAFVEPDSAILLTTSVVQAAVGPGGGIIPDALSGDQDLLDLSGQSSINDCAILEFDFIASSDSVRFNYVFSSMEYSGFTCSGYNDAFGFFLSGPGINGPFSNNSINIALIPGTDTPVAINTINSGVPSGNNPASTCEAANPNWIADSQYFIGNDPIANDDVQYNGMTVTLTALADVECGGQYHIKLAIGDALDGALDSGVFIEAGSFAAFGEVLVDVSPSIGGITVTDPQYQDVLVAGCSEFEIELTRPDGLPVDSVFVIFGGTAVQDEDYQLGENDTLFFFPDGVDTLNFAIETLWDGVYGEDEEITIMVMYPNGCGVYDTSFASMPMIDPYALQSVTENVELFCPTDITSITAEGLNGIGPYEYDWGDLGLGETVPVDVPVGQEYYVVGISDACGFEVLLDSVLVTNSIPPPLQTSILPFGQPTCPNEPVLLEAATTGGNGDYTYVWSRGSGTAISGDPSVSVNYIFDTEIQLMIVDTCGTIVNDTTMIVYPEYDALTVSFTPLEDNCPEAPVQLLSQTQGGAGENVFTWSQIAGEGEFVMSQNEQNSAIMPSGGMNIYQIEVTDRCYRQGYVGINPGNAIFVDSLRVIDLSDLPNVITPNGDNMNEFLVIKGVEEFDDARLEVFDRWGRLVFETDNYMAGFEGGVFDNAFKGKDLEDGTYFYVINVDSGECTESGTIEILGSND